MRTATLIFQLKIDEQKYIDKLNDVSTTVYTIENTAWDEIVEDVIREMTGALSNTQFIGGIEGTKLKESGEEVFHISTEWVD